MRSLVCPSALALLLLTAGCAQEGPPGPPPGAIAAGQSIGSAEIYGRVTFKGQVPPREEINMTSDPVCGAAAAGAAREDVLVGANGALQNVFVRVASGLGSRVFAPPSAAVTLDQRGCSYHPHVLGIQVDQWLEIVNSDPTLHNIHSVPVTNKPFNVGMPSQGMRIRRFFTSPEVMVKVKCDLHNWMIAWVGVMDHPFFDVTREEGGFAIKGLPPGDYVIEAWHELFGARKAEVKLGEGERKEISFEFQP